MIRLNDRQWKLWAAREQIEASLADAVHAELAGLWRKIYQYLRYLDKQRPMFKSHRALRKQSLIGDKSLWDAFSNKLKTRLTQELKTGTVTMDQIHNTWLSRYVDEGDLPYLDPNTFVAANKADIGYKIKDITAYTKDTVGNLVSEWYSEPGRTLEDLVTQLAPLFNEKRASSIAMTETTWLHSAVTRSQMEKMGVDEWWWQTRRDEIVCKKCKERHGKIYKITAPMPPEASHPHCRCDAVPRITQAHINALKTKKLFDHAPKALPTPTLEPEIQIAAFDDMNDYDREKIASYRALLTEFKKELQGRNTVDSLLDLHQKITDAVKDLNGELGKATKKQSHTPAGKSELNQIAGELNNLASQVDGKLKQVGSAPPVIPSMKLSVNQYVDLKHKHQAGGILTQEEIAAAEAFADKTWHKKFAWIEDQKNKSSLNLPWPDPQPITVNEYVALAHKAEKQLLSPQELSNMNAFSVKTWKKPPAWIDEMKAGKLKAPKAKAGPAVKVVKEPKKKATSDKTKVEQAANPIQTPAPVVTTAPPWKTPDGGLNHDMLKQVDMHDVMESWQGGGGQYGTIIINDAGQVLLREPKGHYQGYVWTHAKGMSMGGEHAVDTAVRTARAKTGYGIQIIGVVPGQYKGTGYFVAKVTDHDPSKMDGYTDNVHWFDLEEATKRIKMSDKAGSGMQRDLAAMNAALDELKLIQSGQRDYSFLFKGNEPLPPPPPKVRKKYTQVDLFAQRKDFPANIDDVKVVGSAGGTTGAQIVQDSFGRKYVMKRGMHEGHLLEEAYADAIYRATGANVPEFQLYDTHSGPVKLSAYIPNSRTLSDVMRSGTASEKNKVKKQLRQHFVTDALLANWDVIGMDADNIMVDEAGQVWRIDNGGSMRTRARGELKGEDWNEYPYELWTMRGAMKEAGDPSATGANAQAIKYFGDIGYKEIGAQCRDIATKRDEILASVPDEARAILEDRLDQIEHLGIVQRRQDKGEWPEGFQDKAGRDTLNLRKSQAFNLYGAKMVSHNKRDSSGDVSISSYKIDGMSLPDWRKKVGGKLVQAIYDHIDTATGIKDAHKAIINWLSSQAGSSWSDGALPIKYWVEFEKGNKNKVHWARSYKEAESAFGDFADSYTKGDRNKLRDVFRLYTLAVQEFTDGLNTKTKLESGDRMRVIRTEKDNVISRDMAKIGDRNVNSQRGNAESCSIITPFFYTGNNVTTQDAPLSNLLANFILPSEPGQKSGALAGDHENECVFCLADQPYNYIGTRSDYSNINKEYNEKEFDQ